MFFDLRFPDLLYEAVAMVSGERLIGLLPGIHTDGAFEHDDTELVQGFFRPGAGFCDGGIRPLRGGRQSLELLHDLQLRLAQRHHHVGSPVFRFDRADDPVFRKVDTGRKRDGTVCLF